MTPLEFLSEQLENVKRALEETRRYSYGPGGADKDYYDECVARLSSIQKSIEDQKFGDKSSTQNPEWVSGYFVQLSELSSWIALIERSRLGEFSWPFAEEIRRIAKKLLVSPRMKGAAEPIVHVVAEGEGYRIVCEGDMRLYAHRRFYIVAFQHSMKHHVLLHAIFGHELGHAALRANGMTKLASVAVSSTLGQDCPLSDAKKLTEWLHSADAPEEVRNARIFESGDRFEFQEADVAYWIGEFISDLVGLLLFGPSFLAAHRTILSCERPTIYTFDPDTRTHPPYALRHAMLQSAMSILGWDKNVINDQKKPAFVAAESCLLTYLDEYTIEWANIFPRKSLEDLITNIKKTIDTTDTLTYKPIDSTSLIELVEKLSKRVPPIKAGTNSDGSPQLASVPVTHILLAGWVYWLGKENFPGSNLNFFQVNQLCDLALLQQRAVDLMLEPHE